jgi:hypothetical protein
MMRILIFSTFLILVSCRNQETSISKDRQKQAVTVIVETLRDHKDLLCGNHLSAGKVKCKFVEDEKSPSHKHLLFFDKNGTNPCPSDLQSVILTMKDSAAKWGPKIGSAVNADYENWTKIENALKAYGLEANAIPLECASDKCQIWWNALACTPMN